MKKAIFTICSLSYIYKSSLLIDSLRVFAKGYDIYHVLCDPPAILSQYSFLLPKGLKIISLDDLSFLDCHWKQLAFQYNVMEFSKAVKPFTFDFLFTKGYEQVIYFDPDIELFSSLEPLTKLLETHDAIVTPYITQPLKEENEFLSNLEIIRRGQFNLGFLALNHCQETLLYIDFWKKNCLDYCVFPYEAVQVFADQLLAELIPSFIERTKVLRSHCYNMAHWNLSQREFYLEKDIYTTKDGPLVFFHFSGVLDDNSSGISKPMQQLKFEPDAAIYQLLQNYLNKTRERKAYFDPKLPKYSFDYYLDGEKILFADRRKYLFMSKLEKEALGDPFTARVSIRKIVKVVGTIRERSNMLEDHMKVVAAYNKLKLRYNILRAGSLIKRIIKASLRGLRFRGKM